MNRIQQIPIFVWIISILVILGIVLRSYHFHEWLQFSPDQARDAEVVRNALAGKATLPLLGPVAGGTYFHLGPAFYYFGYFSSFIFGTSPDAMAYPILFFSVLTIPLLFLFLRKYFKTNLALALTALYVFSYYAIIYSRFSWNPNLIPFFVLLFLYGLLEILNDGASKKKMIWPILAGVGLGIGVQLHTLLLIIMPSVVFLIALYLFAKKRIAWKSFLILIAVALILNVPQVASEASTGGQNTKSFFSGAGKQTGGGGVTLRHLATSAACQIEANFHIVSGFENKEECDTFFAIGKYDVKRVEGIPGNFQDKGYFVASVVVAMIFSLIGYALLIFYWLSEKEASRKNFLGLVLLFSIVTLFFFWPVASNLYLRYYIILIFMPFVLLGLWCNFALKIFGKAGFLMVVVVCCILIFSNVFVIQQTVEPYRNGLASDGENSILGEIEPVAEYIVKKSDSSKGVYIFGERSYEERYSDSLRYLVAPSGISLLELDKVNEVNQNSPQFYILKKKKKGKYPSRDELNGKTVAEQADFGKIRLLLLK